MYRFRAIEKLLGEEYQELERQEIFFASNELLNDPLEGFKEIVWRGDSILWENFFKHYLVCLMDFIEINIMGKETSEQDVNVYLVEEILNTESHRKIFSDIKNNFFKKEIVINILKKMSLVERSFYEKEILCFFSFVHEEALDSVSYGFNLNGIKHFKFEKNSIVSKKDNNLLVDIFKILDISSVEESRYQISSLSDYLEDIKLVIEYEGINSAEIILRFPNYYVKKIKKLVHKNWYTACFMSECSNSAVWSHYGENHKGVCLIYKTININGDETIKMSIHKVEKDKEQQLENMKFEKIDYNNEPLEIDFFSSLVGVFPWPILEKEWYYNDCGEISGGFKKINNIDDWRKEYWNSFTKAITRKTKDWEYEKESRLITYNLFHGDLKDKKYRYDFNDLEGVIFGINTLTQHKKQIMRIINKKCTELDRKDFKFYQAEFSKKTGKIEKRELSLMSKQRE